MKLKLAVFALAAASLGNAHGQSYTSTTATTAWNASRWNNSADGPTYSSTFTANNAVNFTSGTYTFAGMGASTNVGNITVASGVSVTFSSTSGSIATGGNLRTIDVGTGGLFDLNGTAYSTAAGTGFIKSGAGVFGTGGGNFTGGFTLNAGTVVARGTTGMGSGATNTLVLNGGTIASNATRDFANTRFGGGITIGGNVQFGELSTVVSIALSTANLSFANNVSLGSATRTLTQGNEGTNTFSGVISNTSGGLTFAATAGGIGRFDITNTANTFTGEININGGEVRFTADGSIGNATNDIVLDGGRFSKASDALTVTLGAGRDISVGDAVGTAISSPGTGVLIYNNAIANKTGETGSWAKQGGGTLELGGVSTYTGDTAINNGFVKLTTGNDRLPTGTVVSLGQAASGNLGTLDLNARNQKIAGLNSTTGTNATAGNNTVTSVAAATLTIGGAGSYSYGDGTNANSGIITGLISLVKQGSGTQTLGDTNTYTGGTTIDAGTVTLGHATNTLSNTGSVAVNGGVLALGTNTETVGAVTLSSGSITGSGTASQGVLTGSSYSLTNSGTISAKLAGTDVTLTKTGAGTATLSSANTYTGTTSISAGTLLVNGDSSAANGAVTVALGATLGGNGTVGGATTITGAHSPGAAANTVGTQMFSGSLTYESGSIFTWNLPSTPGTATRGTDYDAVTAGNLAGSGAIFRVVLDGSQNFDETFWNTNKSWTNVFTNAANTPLDPSTVFSSFEFHNSSGVVSAVPINQGNLSWSGGTLNWTAVPEPSSALAGLLLGAGLLRRRRSA